MVTCEHFGKVVLDPQLSQALTSHVKPLSEQLVRARSSRARAGLAWPEWWRELGERFLFFIKICSSWKTQAVFGCPSLPSQQVEMHLTALLGTVCKT